MTRLAAAVLLVFPAAARADMGLPWPLQHYVPVRIAVHLDDPPPGVALFVETYPGGLRRLPPDSPFVVDSGRPGGASFSIFSVPVAALERFGGEMPPRDWFTPTNPSVTHVGSGGAKGRLDFNDGRSEIVLDYRLVRHGDRLSVVTLSENAGSSWYAGMCCTSGLAVPLGVAWLGVWAVRRWMKPGAKTR